MKSKKYICLVLIFLIAQLARGGVRVDSKGSANLQSNATALTSHAKMITLNGRKASAAGVIVKFKQGESSVANISATLVQNNLKEARSFTSVPGLKLLKMKSVGVQSLDSGGMVKLIAALKKTGQFEYVEPDWVVTVQQLPTDASFVDGTLWGLRNTGQAGGVAGVDVNAESAWGITTGDPTVVVGVIDTGIRYTHQDLVGNMWTNPGETPGDGIDNDLNGYVDDVYGINAITGSGDPLDDNDHGSHCAGTIAATAFDSGRHVGVAYDVRLMGLKFLNASGSGQSSDAITCVEYAIEQGVDILSNSWGGGGFSQAMNDVIEAANSAGILFVAAAGNDAKDNDSSNSYPSGYEVPNVISVAAIDRSGNLASFSNYGANTVDIAAPGVAILSCTSESDSSYGTFQGTSMATPHVSGVAALLVSQFPTASIEEIKNRIVHSATLLPTLTGRVLSGGFADAHGALTLAEDDVMEVQATSNSALESGAFNDIFISVTDLFPVTNATVSAYFDGEAATAFLNDGLSPDEVASDSIYTASLLAPSGSSSVNLNIDVVAPGKTPASVVIPFSVINPPANDDFADRFSLVSGTTQTSGTNQYASSEADEPRNPSVSGGKSVWWEWTSSTTASVTISTTGSNFDTTLAIYQGSSLASLSLVGANDDASGLQSAVTFSAVSGQMYQVQVDGYGASVGDIQLNYPSPAGGSDIPSIITQPSGRTVIEGDPFSLSVVANGTAPLAYQWSLDGAPVVGAYSSSYSVASSTVADAGAYTVEISNSFGSVTSNVAYVSVNPVGLTPDNDDLEDAQVLGGSVGTVSGSNIRGTGESGEPNHADVSTPLASVWYRWTAPSDGSLIVDTTGSDFDTVLAIYSGADIASLSLLASNDDTDGTQSEVSIVVSAGAVYQVAVDGVGAAEGLIALNYAFVPDISGVANDAFSDRIALSGSETTTGTNVGATGETGEAVHAGVSSPLASAWWTWTAPADGELSVDTLGSDFDTTLAVYTGVAVDSLTVIGSNDDFSGLLSRVTLAVTSGSTYQIAVDGYASSEGNINLTVAFTANETPPNGGEALYFEDDASGTYLGLTALQNLGYTVTIIDEDTQSLPADLSAYDLLVIEVYGSSIAASDETAIVNYVNSGKPAVINYWNFNASTALQAAFQATVAQSINTPETLNFWDGASSLFDGISGPLVPIGDNGGADNGDKLDANAGAFALAGYSLAETAGQGAIVRGNSGRTIVNGFAAIDFNGTDMVQLFENEMSAVAPLGGTLYFSEDANADGLYRFDVSTGAAINLGRTGVTGSTVGLAPSSSADYLYGSLWSGLVVIQTDGSAEDIIGGAGLEGLAYDAGRDLLYGSINGVFYVIDQASGVTAATLAAPGLDAEGLAHDGTDTIYAVGSGDSVLYAYDIPSNSWSSVFDTSIVFVSAGLAYDAGAGVLYAKRGNDTNLYRIDPMAQTIEVVGDTGITNGGGLAFVRFGSSGGPANQAPVANAGADASVVDTGGDGSEVVTLDGSGSFDPGGSIVSWEWTWTGGAASGELSGGTFPLGTTLVTLTVTDDEGATDSDTVNVTVTSGSDPDLTGTHGDFWDVTSSSLNINEATYEYDGIVHYDAFDGASLIRVDGNSYLGTLASHTATTSVGTTVTVSEIDVTVSFELLPDRPAIRTLVVLENHSGSALNKTLAWYTNLGSDGGTVTHMTSSGEDVFDLTDFYSVTNDQIDSSSVSFDPTIVSYWGDGDALQPTVIPSATDVGWIQMDYALSLAIGERMTFVFVHELSHSGDAGQAAAQSAYVSNELLAGLSAPDLSDLMNWSSSSGAVLLVEDQGGFGASESLLQANGYDVTVVNDEYANGYATLLDGSYLSQFAFVVYGERGAGGGSELPESVRASLESYIQNGGHLLVTGYDTLGSPTDSALASLVRATGPGDYVSSNPTWAVSSVDHPILNGPFGDFRGQTFSATSYDDDLLTPDTAAGAVELISTGSPRVTGKLIFTDLPEPAGSVGYWNGGLSGATADAQPDFSDAGNAQAVFLNYVSFAAGSSGGGPVNQPPVADAGADLFASDANDDGVESVVLDGSGSFDLEGSIVSWDWTWSGGGATGEVTSGSFPVGITTVTLTVTDDQGANDSDTVDVEVVIPTFTVSFDLAPFGSRTGGGELVQLVEQGAAAVAPIFDVDLGWYFAGWDLTFDSVVSDITVSAQFAPVNFTVMFDLGSLGTRTGGGELVQTVQQGTDATAPIFDVVPGWTFTGWDISFSHVLGDLIVNAEYAPAGGAPVERDLFYDDFEAATPGVGNWDGYNGWTLFGDTGTDEILEFTDLSHYASLGFYTPQGGSGYSEMFKYFDFTGDTLVIEHYINIKAPSNGIYDPYYLVLYNQDYNILGNAYFIPSATGVAFGMAAGAGEWTLDYDTWYLLRYTIDFANNTVDIANFGTEFATDQTLSNNGVPRNLGGFSFYWAFDSANPGNAYIDIDDVRVADLLPADSIGRISEVEPNNDFASAHMLYPEAFHLEANSDVENATTIPHSTVVGSGDGSLDYYRIDLIGTENSLIVDIDYTSNLDSYIAVWDSAGNVVGVSDDSSTSDGAGGSNSGLDSFISLSGLPAGTYYIGVGEYSSIAVTGGFDPSSNAPDSGDAYELQVSTDSFLPQMPEIEVEVESALLSDGGAGIDFGAIVGGLNVARTVTVRNVGGALLNNIALSLAGLDLAEFSAGSLPLSILPGGDASFELSFNPDISSSGDLVATLQIESNDEDESPFDIALLGRTGAPIELFQAAAQDAGLTGADALPDAQPYGDGVDNLLKYAFNLPLNQAGVFYMNPEGDAGLPRFGMLDADPMLMWQFEFVRRKGVGLSYQAMISDELTEVFTAVEGSQTVDEIDATWERVIIETSRDPSTQPKGFGYIDVSLD